MPTLATLKGRFGGRRVGATFNLPAPQRRDFDFVPLGIRFIRRGAKAAVHLQDQHGVHVAQLSRHQFEWHAGPNRPDCPRVPVIREPIARRPFRSRMLAELVNPTDFTAMIRDGIPLVMQIRTGSCCRPWQ